jgi:acyl-CoA synthetase
VYTTHSEDAELTFTTIAPPEEVLREYRGRGWWDDDGLPGLLGDALQKAQLCGFSTYSRSGRRRVTLLEVAELGWQVAAGLRRRGIGSGDTVAFQLPNSVEAAAIFYGLVHVGAVLVPLGHGLGTGEVLHALQQSSARVALLDERVNVDFAEIATQRVALSNLEHIIMVGDTKPHPSVISFESLTDLEPDRRRVDVDAAQPAVIGWTSGSTAEPKGVLLSHRALCAEIRFHMAPMLAQRRRPLLSTSPISHVTGMLISLLVPPLVGQDVHLMDYWDSGDALTLMAEHGLSAGSGAPIFLQTLLEDPRCTPAHCDLVAIASLGGATVSPELIRHADRLGIKATRGYGCTEHPSIALGRPDDELTLRAQADGPPCPGVEVQILDDDQNLCAPGEIGEICTRGPDLFSGYLDPAVNADAFHRGWFRTGDVGRLDANGYLTVVDRKKDIIIRAGMNISAAEVEAILSSMPEVAEAAAVAAPDARTGEHVCAFIRLAPGRALPTLSQVREHMASAGIAKYKWPEELRLQSEDFPRSPSGKVRKADLRRTVSG